MKRYKCTVSYIGAGYHGWQSQADGTGIQDVIETAVRRVAAERVSIKASGRTDAGVSARKQVFHFDTERELSPRKWQGAINSFLPKDIHIISVEETDRLFHARYCVKMKQYDYRINLGTYDVFTADTAYQCPVPLDIEKMKEASKYLIGTHDFTALNSSPLSEYPDQVRTVKDIVFRQEGSLLTISFFGKGFLRYMVRMMTAVMIEAGKGKLQPEEIPGILERKSRTSGRRNAPANGLILADVQYFRVLAIGREYMIRQRLEGDDVSLLQTVPEYVFVQRHGQKVCGYYDDVQRILYVKKGYDEEASAVTEMLAESGTECEIRIVI